MPVDPVSLEVFKNMFESVAEEMGVALQRTSYSPNIKERRDFSCAVFDPEGNMVRKPRTFPFTWGRCRHRFVPPLKCSPTRCVPAISSS